MIKHLPREEIKNPTIIGEIRAFQDSINSSMAGERLGKEEMVEDFIMVDVHTINI